MTSICILLQSHYDVDIRVRRKAEALAAAGYDVDVLALQTSPSKVNYTIAGVKVHTVALGKKRGSLARYLFEYLAFWAWAFYKLSVLMRQKSYAMIDTNNLPDFLVFAAAYAKWRGSKVVLDMHEITPEFFISKYKMLPDSLSVKLLKSVESASLKYADYVININHPIEDVLVTRGLRRSKSTIIMNSVDEEFFATSSTNASISTPPRPKFLMMYHGTITSIYGLDIAIEAFALASKNMPDAEFWILGRNTEETNLLQRQVQTLGLEGKVRFVGLVAANDIPHWIKLCDVGILATRQDLFLDLSFSGKLSEYIVSGKPVIASRLKTIRHYFSEQALAFFEPHNCSELAEQMTSLYNDPARRNRLAESAKREYAPLRWEVMRRRYLDLVDSITGRDSAAADKQASEVSALKVGVS